VGDEEADDIEKVQKQMESKKKEFENLSNVKVKLESELKNKAVKIGHKSFMVGLLNDQYHDALSELKKKQTELDQVTKRLHAVESTSNSKIVQLAADKQKLGENMLKIQARESKLQQELDESKIVLQKLQTQSSLFVEQKQMREETNGSGGLKRSSTAKSASIFKALRTAEQAGALGSPMVFSSDELAESDEENLNLLHQPARRDGAVLSGNSLNKIMPVKTITNEQIRDDHGLKPNGNPVLAQREPFQSVSTITSRDPEPAAKPTLHRTVSMASQTDKLNATFAMELLGREEPLSVCIKILEDERRKKEVLGATKLDGNVKR